MTRQVPSSSSSSTVQVPDGHVEVVDAFIYLACMIDSSGGSREKVLRWIGLTRSCMNMLERRIWKPSIRLETKLCLYQTYIVQVLMYGCETWATTKFLLSRLDACSYMCCSVVFGITLRLLVINMSSSSPAINKLCHLLPLISVTTCHGPVALC